MNVDIRLPEGEQAFGEGTVLSWKIREGETVRKGQVIAEIETPKAIVEFESPENGVVSRLLVAEGEAFPMKDPVAVIDRPEAPDAARIETAAAAAAAARETAEPGAEGPARIPASPAAKRIARERGVDLALVRGTGPGGRIVESDVLAFAEAGGQAPAAGPEPAEDRTVPLSPMRRTAAARLVQSKQTAPHYYLTTEVAADRLWAEYLRMKPAREISLNDFVVKAAAEALREFPEVNSSVQGDVQIFRGRINIGVAVSVEGGLRIPVLRDADRMSLEEIGRASAVLAAKAREGKVEGSGTGAFTVSNLGMFGITEFAAVINPPEAAILAVGRVRETAVVRDGSIAAGRVLSLTLSCDHRAFDGAAGAAFLARVREILENAGS